MSPHSMPLALLMCLAIAASSAIAGDDDLIKVQHTPSGSSASDVSVNELELVEEPTYDFDDFVTAVSNTADEAAKHTGKQKLLKFLLPCKTYREAETSEAEEAAAGIW